MIARGRRGAAMPGWAPLLRPTRSIGSRAACSTAASCPHRRRRRAKSDDRHHCDDREALLPCDRADSRDRRSPSCTGVGQTRARPRQRRDCCARNRRSRHRRRARRRAASGRRHHRTHAALGASTASATSRTPLRSFSRDGRYAYRVRPRRRAQQSGSARAARLTQSRHSGRQLDRRRDLAGRPLWSPSATTSRAACKLFDAATLELVADMPAQATVRTAKRSKVVGLADAPGSRFVFACTMPARSGSSTRRPAPAGADDATAASAGSPTTAWSRRTAGTTSRGCSARTASRCSICGTPSRACGGSSPATAAAKRSCPVYKMPHLDGWAVAGRYALPARGRASRGAGGRHWRPGSEVGRIPVQGQPVFAIARPDGRQVWVNFALPDNGTVQVIDIRDAARS